MTSLENPRFDPQFLPREVFELASRVTAWKPSHYAIIEFPPFRGLADGLRVIPIETRLEDCWELAHVASRQLSVAICTAYDVEKRGDRVEMTVGIVLNPSGRGYIGYVVAECPSWKNDEAHFTRVLADVWNRQEGCAVLRVARLGPGTFGAGSAPPASANSNVESQAKHTRQRC